MNQAEIELFREQAKAELNRLEAQSSAKEVAGKAIGKQALLYIFLIVVVGVVASLYLEESKLYAPIFSRARSRLRQLDKINFTLTK